MACCGAEGRLWRVSIITLFVVLGAAGAQEVEPPVQPEPPGNSTPSPAEPRRLPIRIEDAVRLATLNNMDLRVAFFDHLVQRAVVAETEARFDPTVTASQVFGNSQFVFPQIFPTGNINPDGTPEFSQVVVTDSTIVQDWSYGANGLLPTGATWNLQVTTNYRDRATGGFPNPSFNTTTSLAFTQPILRNAWLQYNYASIRQARYSEAQIRQQYRSNVVSKVFEVHSAYWNLVFAVQDLAVKERSLELAQKLLEINRVRVDTGVFAPIEVVSAESEVANRVTEVQVARNTVADSLDILKRLVLPFHTLDDWDIDLVPLDELSEETVGIPALSECIDTALKERPDLADARLELRNRAISVAVADNETLPRLDLNGNLSFAGLANKYSDSYVDSFDSERGANSWNVGLSLEVPLGNRAARARLSQRRLERDRAVMAFRRIQLDAVAAVRRAYRNVVIALETIDSRRKAAELKAEEVTNEQVKLDNQVSTNFQVLQVQEDLARRRSEYYRALVDYRISLAELASAMGSSPAVLGWK